MDTPSPLETVQNSLQTTLEAFEGSLRCLRETARKHDLKALDGRLAAIQANAEEILRLHRRELSLIASGRDLTA